MARLLTGYVVRPDLVSVQLKLLAFFHKKKVVFTNGCFDLLHAGHVSLLKKAKKLGDYLVVAVNSDESVRALKGDSRPVQTLNDRMAVLSELRCVDFVTWFDEPTPMRLIENIRPHFIVKGDDYKPQEVVGFSESKDWGGQVVIMPRISGISTTGILKACGK